MKLSDELLHIINEEGISFTQLAAKLDVSSSMLSAVISGRAKPGLKFLAGLHKRYRKIANNILEGKYDDIKF